MMSIEMDEKEMKRVFKALSSCNWMEPAGKASDALIQRIDSMQPGQSESLLRYAFNFGQILASVEAAQSVETNLPGAGSTKEIESQLAGCGVDAQAIGNISDALYERMRQLELQAFRYGYYAALEQETAK